MDNGHMTTTPNWRARYEQLEKDHDRTVEAWQAVIAANEILLTEGKILREALEEIADKAIAYTNGDLYAVEIAREALNRAQVGQK